MKKPAPILLLIIVFVTMAWYFLIREPEQLHEVLPPHQPPVVAVTEQQALAESDPVQPDGDFQDQPEPEPEQEVVPDPLPLLSDSDPRVSEELAALTGADLLAEYIVKDQIISRMVTTIDSLTSRQVPALINPIKPADGKFIAEAEGESIVMSGQNFARYDGYIALMQSVNSSALTALYQRYYPLFQQAWEENGGEGSFNERLKEVIDHLLETPDVPGPVYLTKPEAVYVFDDEELEAMTAGQKILVRMGSVNASLVKETLTGIRKNL